MRGGPFLLRRRGRAAVVVRGCAGFLRRGRGGRGGIGRENGDFFRAVLDGAPPRRV